MPTEETTTRIEEAVEDALAMYFPGEGLLNCSLARTGLDLVEQQMGKAEEAEEELFPCLPEGCPSLDSLGLGGGGSLSSLGTMGSSVILGDSGSSTPGLLKAIVKHLLIHTPEDPALAVLELLTKCDSVGEEGLTAQLNDLLRDLAEAEGALDKMISAVDVCQLDVEDERELAGILELGDHSWGKKECEEWLRSSHCSGANEDDFMEIPNAMRGGG